MNRQSSFLQQLDLSELQSFVLKRLQSDGGFGATPMLPHTIMDTFCGVKILYFLQDLLQENQYRKIIAHEQTRQYLIDFSTHRDTVPARIKYQLVILLKLFSLPLTLLPPVSRDSHNFRGFEELYYLSILGEKIPFPPPLPETYNFMSMQDKCVKDCFFYLRWRSLTSFSNRRPIIPARDELLTWLIKSQGRDGGFGFYPGTTSFIENCRYALAALAMIGSRPAEGGKAADFIVSCQTGAGGFSRNPMAAPFLENSLHALYALLSLQQMYG